MDPDFFMEGILKELQSALEGMEQADSVQEKKDYSQIIKNLSKSMEIFFNIASDFVDFEEEL